MSDTPIDTLNLNELCEIAVVSRSTIIEIVEQGIVEPLGDKPESWLFDTSMIVATRKALRLHHDLEIDWSGIAFTLSLLDELEELREENKALMLRVNRLEHNPGSD